MFFSAVPQYTGNALPAIVRARTPSLIWSTESSPFSRYASVSSSEPSAAASISASRYSMARSTRSAGISPSSTTAPMVGLPSLSVTG